MTSLWVRSIARLTIGNFKPSSGSYDDQVTGNILDSTTATIDEEDDKEMQRL